MELTRRGTLAGCVCLSAMGVVPTGPARHHFFVHDEDEGVAAIIAHYLARQTGCDATYLSGDRARAVAMLSGLRGRFTVSAMTDEDGHHLTLRRTRADLEAVHLARPIAPKLLREAASRLTDLPDQFETLRDYGHLVHTV